MIIRKKSLLTLDSKDSQTLRCTNPSRGFNINISNLPKLDFDKSKTSFNLPNQTSRSYKLFNTGLSDPLSKGLHRNSYTERNYEEQNLIEVAPFKIDNPQPLAKVQFTKQANKISSLTNPSRVPYLSVQNLVKLISDRKKTFVKFSFKSVELNEERNLWPFVKDFLGKEQRGSMFVNELWSSGNLARYVRQSNFLSSKRLVKRLASTSKAKRQQMNENKILTSKDELQLRLKISTRSQANLQADISKKFQNDGTIIKLIEHQLADVNKVSKNADNFKEEFNKVQNNFITLSQHKMKFILQPTTEKMIIHDIITKIDEVIIGTTNDKKHLDNLITKLEDQIVKRRIKISSNSMPYKSI